MSQKILEQYLWINNSFFESALRRKFDDDSLFLKTFEVTNEATKRNESYWCDIIKLELNYTDSGNDLKSQNVILKVGYYSAYMEESMEKYNPFKRELFFYQDVMPKIEGLLLSVGDNGDLSEKVICIVNERPQPKYLMFEELPRSKFTKVDRRSGLNVQHLKIAVEKLAQLHAASAVLNCDDVNIFTHHQQPNISEYFKTFHSLFINCVKSLVDETSSDADEEAKALAEKLNAFERNLIDKVSEAFMLQEGDFGVLCHGDLWLNNLLFEYNEDSKPVDVRMLEFGLSYFGSPAIDLSYLLFTSSSDDVKDYEIDVLLQFYHKTLHENLMKMNYSLPIPSLIQIHSYFLRCGVIGFLYSCLLLPMRFSSSPRDLSALVDQSEEALEIRKQLFSDEALKKRFQFLLNYFDRKGFLD